MSLHTATFQLLGFEPQPSTTAEAAVRQAETRLAMPLPRAVRDWYGRADAVKILADHSNADPPVPVQDFAVIDGESHPLLPVRRENQGVCRWAIELNGADDPPVLVDVDTGGEEWLVAVSSFSRYVYSSVWDYRRVFGQAALMQAQNGPLSPAALETLTNLFAEEIRTHGWPGSIQYRFCRHGLAILIWDSPQQADWYVAGPAAEALESALDDVWRLDDVGKWLYGCSPAGEEMLQRVRSRA